EKTRADIASVGKIAAAGNLEEARNEAWRRGLFDQAGNLDTMAKVARSDLAAKTGQVALLSPDEATFRSVVLPALKSSGIDVSMYDQPGGRELALAHAGLGTKAYEQQGREDLQNLRQQGATEVARLKADRGQGGTAFMKNVAYVKSAYPGI